MFLKNRSGAINTTEMIMIIMITLIAIALPVYNLMKTFGNRMDDINNRIK